MYIYIYIYTYIYICVPVYGTLGGNEHKNSARVPNGRADGRGGTM